VNVHVYAVEDVRYAVYIHPLYLILDRAWKAGTNWFVDHMVETPVKFKIRHDHTLRVTYKNYSGVTIQATSGVYIGGYQTWGD